MSDIATAKVKPSSKQNYQQNDPYINVQITDKPNRLRTAFMMETEVQIGDKHPNALTIYIEPPEKAHPTTTKLTCELTVDNFIAQCDATWFQTYQYPAKDMDIADGFRFQALFDNIALLSTDTSYYDAEITVDVKPI